MVIPKRNRSGFLTKQWLVHYNLQCTALLLLIHSATSYHFHIIKNAWFHNIKHGFKPFYFKAVRKSSQISPFFLAAMSSSRSDEVTQSVCMFVPFFSFSVSGVCITFGCFKEVSRMFQESFKGVSRKFLGCFNEVSRKF